MEKTNLAHIDVLKNGRGTVVLVRKLCIKDKRRKNLKKYGKKLIIKYKDLM
jgi:hypothetical protein